MLDGRLLRVRGEDGPWTSGPSSGSEFLLKWSSSSSRTSTLLLARSNSVQYNNFKLVCHILLEKNDRNVLLLNPKYLEKVLKSANIGTPKDVQKKV